MFVGLASGLMFHASVTPSDREHTHTHRLKFSRCRGIVPSYPCASGRPSVCKWARWICRGVPSRMRRSSTESRMPGLNGWVLRALCLGGRGDDGWQGDDATPADHAVNEPSKHAGRDEPPKGVHDHFIQSTLKASFRGFSFRDALGHQPSPLQLQGGAQEDEAVARVQREVRAVGCGVVLGAAPDTDHEGAGLFTDADLAQLQADPGRLRVEFLFLDDC